MRKLFLLSMAIVFVGMAGYVRQSSAQFSNQPSGGMSIEAVKQAAEQGDAQAQYVLGAMYAHGNGGLAKNDRKAMEWFRKAAEQGDSKAQHAVARGYRYGLGVAKDEKRAREWYSKAEAGLRKLAEQGDAQAQFSLFDVLSTIGDGAADVTNETQAKAWLKTKAGVEAVKWLKKAAAQGHQLAQEGLNHAKQAGLI